MRIHDQGRSESAGYSERAGRTNAAGGDRANASSRSRQVGLDRVDVSETAETAYRVVTTAAAAREERITELTSQVQGGGYAVDLSRLSEAVLDFDSEPDIHGR